MGDIRAEPSMDEILASIKRIIADDGLAVSGGRPRFRLDAADSPIPAPTPEPVLELTEPVAPQPAVPQAPEPPAAPPIAATAPVSAPISPPTTPAPHEEPAPAAATLVSENAACASRQALSNLSSMVLRTPDSENTLDGLVRELLRPMLKDWLDSHLPDLVEALVSREIARITGKAL